MNEAKRRKLTRMLTCFRSMTTKAVPLALVHYKLRIIAQKWLFPPLGVFSIYSNKDKIKAAINRE